jgi:hypothetical protein
MIILEQLVLMKVYKISYNTFLQTSHRSSKYLYIRDIITKVTFNFRFLVS